METFLDIIQDFFYVVVQHPVYSTVGILVLLIYSLRLYCKFTAGICNIDQDMSGKTVLITGASAGVGKATAFDLAKRNARVLMACRNVGKGNKVAEEIKKKTGNQNVIVKCLDLTSFESVRHCAESVLKTEDKLHILINNAGIVGGDGKYTADGCEIVMQSNHYGHFLLTMLLLDLLKKSSPSRIINVSSSGHHHGDIKFEELNNGKKISNLKAYSDSKLANVLFTRELSKRLKGTGITVNALHPGLVKTDIMQFGVSLFLSVIFKINGAILGKTPEIGAQTSIRLAIDPSLEHTTGKYFADCEEAPVSKIAQDETSAKRLFENSEKITGVSFPKL